VTLICFGACQPLINRFLRLAGHQAWEVTIETPYDLYVIVLDELFRQMDAQVWNLSGVFRGMEHVSQDFGMTGLTDEKHRMPQPAQAKPQNAWSLRLTITL
jgi:hypothetical protein